MKKLSIKIFVFVYLSLFSSFAVAASMQGSGTISSDTTVSAFAPLPQRTETALEIFASGHGYVKQSAQGTQSDDTTDFIVGGQSLKLVSDGAGSAVFTRSPVLSPVWDLSGDQVVIKLRINDVSLITELWLFATSDSFTSAWYTWKLNTIGLTNYAVDSEWFVVTLNISDAIITGTPNRAAIDKIQLRIKDDSTVPVTVNFNYIGTMPEPTAGMVTFAFDDGWASQYTEAKKKLSEYGFPAIGYPISGLVDTSGYMTMDQIRELQDIHGWDIGVHHQTNFTTVSLGEAENLIKQEKRWHLNNGFNRGSDHFAIPNGAFNLNLLKLFRRYFRTARTIGTTAETFPPADWNRLRILNVIDTTTTASIAAAVDNARTNKYWLILLFHKIVASPTVSTEYSILNFGIVVDDIAIDGIKVKSMTQAIIDG